MKVIGLTGGICSGKSTVSKLFEEKGVYVIDADKLGHSAYAVGTKCYDKIIDAFGADIISSDGSIDRRKLGGIVFAESQKMKLLESLVWPEIRASIENIILEHSNEDFVVVEAAILIEAQWMDLFSSIIVVEVDPEMAIQRLVSRNNLSMEAAKMRLNSQLTNDERRKYGNYVIRNDSTTEHLQDQFNIIWEKLTY